MKIKEEIFRSYDIRGIYPSEVNEEVAFFVGRAFVRFLKKKNPKIVIGRDNRLSSDILFKNLCQGILEEGGKILDIGLAPTPMFYFGVVKLKADGGIQITASHNPPKYNGFKLVREKAFPIGKKSGLKKIQKIIQSLVEKKEKIPEIKKIKALKKDILREYLDFCFKGFDPKKWKGLKIVIDTANAVGGILLPELKKRLPCQVFPLFEKLDGSFPNHLPDPLKKENIKVLSQKVKEKRADLGVAFDGDGDRILFVDEKGKMVSGDLILALISFVLLKEKPGLKILYDIRSTKIVREIIKKYKGKGYVCRIGHSFIKEKMRKEDIFFGGEFSGHYYAKRAFFSEDPFFVMFKVLEVLSQEKKKLSEILKPFKKYFHSGEINFSIRDKEKVLKFLEEKYQKGKITKLDGLRVDFKDWWFLARPSGTENLLRLVVEADNKKLMEEKKKELSLLISSF